jgi:hypothetical protein
MTRKNLKRHRAVLEAGLPCERQTVMPGASTSLCHLIVQTLSKKQQNTVMHLLFRDVDAHPWTFSHTQ